MNASKNTTKILNQNVLNFQKYIRNGKDHFNNGYSTEMVYDEWVKSISTPTKLNDNAESLCFCCSTNELKMKQRYTFVKSIPQ
jgi:hypothetical protein